MQDFFTFPVYCFSLHFWVVGGGGGVCLCFIFFPMSDCRSLHNQFVGLSQHLTAELLYWKLKALEQSAKSTPLLHHYPLIIALMTISRHHITGFQGTLEQLEKEIFLSNLLLIYLVFADLVFEDIHRDLHS